MEKQKKPITKWLYYFTLGAALIILFKTFDNFSEILGAFSSVISIIMPFLAAILIAYLFYIPSRNLEKFYHKFKFKWVSKHARALSVFSVYLIALIILLVAFNFVIPPISNSIMELINNLPGYFNELIQFINELPDDYMIGQFNPKEMLQGLSSIDLRQLFNFDNLAQYAKGIFGFATSIFNIFITLIVSVYILLERKDIMEFLRNICKALFSKDINKNLARYFYKTNDIFFKFVSSQLIDAVVVAIITSIAFSIMNIKYALLLGFMIGLFNIIPCFGAIIAVVLSVIITIFTGGITQAIWLAVVATILQQIDANIINPHIIGDSLKISPLLVIFAVTIGGALGGLLWMFLSVPIIAVLKILLLDFIKLRNSQKELKQEEQPIAEEQP